MDNQISAVKWRTAENTLEIELEDGRYCTVDAYAFMEWMAHKYEGWLFEPHVGTVVIPFGKRAKVCTPKALHTDILGEPAFFERISEWLDELDAEFVEEEAEDLQDAADDAWRAWRKEQGIL